MEYLKYFENKTSAEGYKTESVFVAYLDEENKVLYSRGGEVIKDGEMVMDEPDPTEGFVDLGLSVMWASCNLGASSPEETGLFYRFNSTLGYTSDQKEILNIPNPNSTDWLIEKDPIYLNSDMINKDLLCPRIPNATQFLELVNNTTISEEVVNGKSVIRFTAENGNSIILPFAKCIVNEYDRDTWIYWTSTMVPDANIDNDYGKAFMYFDTMSSGDMITIYGLPLRGICNLPPLCLNILYHNKSVQLNKGENYFTLLPEDISSCILTASTTMPIKIAGLNSTSDPTLSTVYNEKAFTNNGTNSILNLTLGDIYTHLNTKEVCLLPKPYVSTVYQYIKIVCEEDCLLEMLPWDTTIYKSNFDATAKLPIAQPVNVAQRKGYKYRIKYADIQSKDLVISWSGNMNLNVYILDDCKSSSVSSSTDARVVQYANISRRSTKTISAATIDSWASRVDREYLYVEFYSNSTIIGNVTFTTTDPEISQS